MPYQRTKFYQTGSFAAGNRLLPAELGSVQSSAGRSNALTCGHRACQGCGEALGARYALDAVVRATKGKVIAVNATGCLEVFSTPFPETSWQVAWLHSLFGNAPAVASGVAAALKAPRQTPLWTYEIDYDYCKGCGICVAECPCGAITMVPEQA
jgi:pyruvate ferredoxin oxidoreductase beta subunit